MKKDAKSRSLQRVKIMKGQLAALEKRIEADDYCMDILTQSLAIQGSLTSLNKLVVKHHIETHISTMLGSSDEKVHDKALKELESLYDLSNVRGKYL